MSKQHLPEGWTIERVQKLASHYENQTDEEATAEDEAAFGEPVTATEAKIWLVDFSKTAQGAKFAVAARAIEKLPESDILLLYRQVHELMAASQRSAKS